MKKYKNAITYGTFDLFHHGHERLLERISDLAENVFVGVSSDAWNNKKNKNSINDENVRLNSVKKLNYVKEVFLEDHNEHTQQWSDDYKKYKIDVIIMGDDHQGVLDKYMRDGMEIVYIPRTEGISSTMLREKLQKK